MDDFAWLSLHTHVHDFQSFLSAIFTPMAQGTVRPLSERLFFLTFWELFGMAALPYRALVFATQFVNLILITLVTRRLTGSAAAGFLAPLLWLASPVLYEPMVWTAAYNQILCAFFLLADMYLLLRYVDTGERRYYVALWISFVLGFGALELNVVFPAIATCYLILFARKYIVRVISMFVVSIVFAIWHRSAGRALENVIYARDWTPASILRVLGDYVLMSVSAAPMASFSKYSESQLNSVGLVVLAALGLFTGIMLVRQNRLILFLLAWFLITLSPYLPLANHVSDYYLTVPMIGVAMLGGWGLVIAWRSNIAGRLTAIAALVVFVVPCSWQAWSLTKKWSQDSRRVRRLVRSLASAQELHPNKTIVLKGVDNDLFWTGVYDEPQRALGWRRVLLTADAQRTIVPFPEKGSIGDRFLPDAATLAAIAANEAVVYDAAQFPLRNITTTYGRMLSYDSQLSMPHVIDAGVTYFAKFRKEGWFEQSGGSCWAGKRATVEMRGPSGPKGQITYHAFLTPHHTSSGPLTVTVSVDGRVVGKSTAPVGVSDLNPTYDLPDDLIGKRSIEVSVEVDRTIVVPPDRRALGLLFGTFEVKP